MKSLQQLKPGTQYIVRVRAMNAIGEGDFTQESSGTTEARGGYWMNTTMHRCLTKMVYHFQFPLFVLRIPHVRLHLVLH